MKTKFAKYFWCVEFLIVVAFKLIDFYLFVYNTFTGLNPFLPNV